MSLVVLLKRVKGKFSAVMRRFKPVAFANKPQDFYLGKPFRVQNPHLITIGELANIGPQSNLSAVTIVRTFEGIQEFNPRIEIGKRVYSPGMLQIYAHDLVVVEDDVLFALNVMLCDATHCYARSDVPYKDQGFDCVAPIKIGKGSWIGQNVVVLPGVEIGRFCVIGANSVVTKSVPDYSIAMGSPARIVRELDPQLGQFTEQQEG